MGNQLPDLRALGFLEPQPRPPRKTPFATQIRLTKTAVQDLPSKVKAHGLKEVEFCCTEHRGLHVIVSGTTENITLYSRYSLGGNPQVQLMGDPFRLNGYASLRTCAL